MDNFSTPEVQRYSLISDEIQHKPEYIAVKYDKLEILNDVRLQAKCIYLYSSILLLRIQAV